jgi:hypothetical protein
MDSATASLIGVAIGGALSLATAVLTPRVNARWARDQFAREAEAKKLDGLQAVLDDAGLALEAVHWALRNALVLRSKNGGLPAGRDDREEWRGARAGLSAAQAEVSRQGTRLAIRLGAPKAGVHSPCVSAYDVLQQQYRALVRELRELPPGGSVDLDPLEQQLDAVGDHHSFLNQAAVLLKPRSV